MQRTSSVGEGLANHMAVDEDDYCDSRGFHEFPSGHFGALFRLAVGVQFTWKCLVELSANVRPGCYNTTDLVKRHEAHDCCAHAERSRDKPWQRIRKVVKESNISESRVLGSRIGEKAT